MQPKQKKTWKVLSSWWWLPSCTKFMQSCRWCELSFVCWKMSWVPLYFPKEPCDPIVLETMCPSMIGEVIHKWLLATFCHVYHAAQTVWWDCDEVNLSRWCWHIWKQETTISQKIPFQELTSGVLLRVCQNQNLEWNFVFSQDIVQMFPLNFDTFKHFIQESYNMNPIHFFHLLESPPISAIFKSQVPLPRCKPPWGSQHRVPFCQEWVNLFKQPFLANAFCLQLGCRVKLCNASTLCWYPSQSPTLTPNWFCCHQADHGSWSKDSSRIILSSNFSQQALW